MRILHVIPYMHPTAGGPPVVVENVVSQTAASGHVSRIITTTRFCRGDDADLIRRLNGLAQTYFLPTNQIQLVFCRHALSQISSWVEWAEVIHIHTCWNIVNLMIRRECERHKRPYVLMPHGYLDPYSLAVKRYRKLAYRWAIEGRTLRGARRIIYTADEEQRLATSAVKNLPRGVVVPLGGDAPLDNTKLTQEFFERFPRARGRRQLLFLGRLDHKKGLDRILRVLPQIAQRCPDVLLTIAGSGSHKFESHLSEAIVAQGVSDHVLLTGWLSQGSKWGAYASSTIFLLPSRQENFAISVAEAMQMGLPVVVSRHVNTWDIVQATGAGVVLDDEELDSNFAARLLSLLSVPEALTEMGRRGRGYARANMTWARTSAKLLECYQGLLR